MTTTDTMDNGDNSKARLVGFFQTVTSLGNASGKGHNSRPGIALFVTEQASAASSIGDLITPEMAPQIWADFRAAEAASAGLGAEVVDEKSAKQQISKFRQFIKLGKLNLLDPVAIITQAAHVVKNNRATGTITMGAYDALLNIAREQLKSPEVTLTDDEMLNVCLPTPQKDKDQADVLGDARDKLQAYLDKFEDEDEGCFEALQAMTARIDELGGTRKERREANKARVAELSNMPAHALASLMRRGEQNDKPTVELVGDEYGQAA